MMVRLVLVLMYRLMDSLVCKMLETRGSEGKLSQITQELNPHCLAHRGYFHLSMVYPSNTTSCSHECDEDNIDFFAQGNKLVFLDRTLYHYH
ncbi:unnamed protein product [Lactuca virosa]|uniref:Secreted protein n=1 Tax=Lactuca virosa TaxID=75947 RepID=A0AAU9P8G6_9ASTR|nr:unnamed protein product [Lactuca virosa]